MVEHNETQKKSGSPWINVIIGLIIVILAGSVPQLRDFDVPLPGIELHLGKTIAMIGMMILLFPLVKVFYVDPLEKAIKDRNENLEHTFEEAENLKQRMQELKTSYENRLKAAEEEAREKIQIALGEAEQMKNQIIAEARSQAEEVRRRNEEELERAKEKMLIDLRTHVVDLTLAATEKVIGQSVDPVKQRQLVEEFISSAEVRN
jgi:F-type H+-transporting ATPase subunit b